ncbi:hypothetical protein P3X46_034017 [Hevea brasiliensis]|uniref:CCHC-type domain-containing protein n=1 Tax=Hevea brasiliensis TaxID=3981 RepID=A0ABQ9KAJ0_HEVBR|nr:hypothetical protein P3X46_034017 [Hevea brasiliensis]
MEVDPLAGSVHERGNDDEDRATKKVKQRKENEDSSTPQVSFHDKLVAGMETDSLMEDGNVEDDFEIGDGDITIDLSRDIPDIKISFSLQTKLARKWSKAVVVRLMGKKLGYKALCNRVVAMWNARDAKIVDLGNDYFLIKFSREEEYHRALLDGPWIINGSYSVLRVIGSAIGWVVKIDYNTGDAVRGKFARIAVSVDLRNPLMSQIRINGKIHKLEYECLPSICFFCGRAGHRDSLCPYKNVIPAVEETSVEPVPEMEKTVEAEKFGPWMVVERKSRRVPRNRSEAFGTDGGRFNVLSNIHDAKINEDTMHNNSRGANDFSRGSRRAKVIDLPQRIMKRGVDDVEGMQSGLDPKNHSVVRITSPVGRDVAGPSSGPHNVLKEGFVPFDNPAYASTVDDEENINGEEDEIVGEDREKEGDEEEDDVDDEEYDPREFGDPYLRD